MQECSLQNTEATSNIYEMQAFQNLSATSKNLLERGLQYYLYAKKKQVLHKGQSVSGAYIVVSGQLRQRASRPRPSRMLKKARLLTLPPWRAETRLVPSKAAASE